ncbi:MAG: type I-MYXAN CRISPR-associated protein Cas6/Cmx6 [Clostridia bacterium]|jgi:CRISPR-associated protein Cas6
MKIDILFPLSFRHESIIPRDHGYLLYSGISRIIPKIHNDDVFIHRIHGINERNWIRLTNYSVIGIRINIDEAECLRELVGSRIRIGKEEVWLGKPGYRKIEMSDKLFVPGVTIKFCEIGSGGLLGNFMDAIHKKIGIDIKVEIKRRAYTEVKGKKLCGYDIFLDGIDLKESIRLQEEGIGGRKRMGCGIPVKPKGIIIQRSPGPIAYSTTPA